MHLFVTGCCFIFFRSAPVPEGSGLAPGNKRLQQTQAQVDEVWYVSFYTTTKLLKE